MRQYDHRKIEKKWQKEWAKKRLYHTPDKAKGKKNFYLLTEFPYPSGNLHVGHWYAFAVPDILARFKRMEGKNVMYPIGFDAFGLPAENAAIKHKLNPRKWTQKNIAYMKKQLASMGASFDWSREVQTIDPSYYKWTQWLFLQFFKKGLAYKKETAVNWCPKDKTVLANEQVVNSACERCGTEVVQKQMLQWNLKITDYADRLADDLAPLDWPEQIKESQKNWIGRSEGAEIDFPVLFAGYENIKRNYILLHGKNGSPTSDFFPWLKEQLERRGHVVHIPTLPNTTMPDDEEQADYVQAHCSFDENTVLVGHSFGGVVALRLLERGVKVHMVTLIGTPCSGTYLDHKKRPTVTAALRKGFNFENIRTNAKHFLLLYDTHDHVVPLSDGEQLAKATGGTLFKERGEMSHFNGTVEPEVLKVCDATLTVFTTRPDTLFGATYLVLAPEHPFVQQTLEPAKDGPLYYKGPSFANEREVRAYVARAGKKTELERQESKEKTGVPLEGVWAVNPATQERIPIFVADYVLSHYGTGAIMAVPAHDERDYEFAKKFDLPVKRVVEPKFVGRTGEAAVREGEPFDTREAVCAVVRNPKDDTYLCVSWKNASMNGLVTGGIDDGEDIVEAARREVREETGYKNLKLASEPVHVIQALFYHRLKKVNRWARFHHVFFELENEERDAIDEKEAALHDVVWKTKDELRGFFTVFEGEYVVKLLDNPDYIHTGEGVLADSGEFSGMDSEEAKRAIAKRYGRPKITYKMRDWVVSRQRYWGVPIPIIHCPKCGDVAVPDKDLPVKLPEVKDYLPTGDGKSPLAKVKKFVQTKCPQCKGKAERETDTLDTFVDSSWYFLRYTDPKNKKTFADTKKMAAWMPVDMYSGGAEHTTMHLLYSRFWQKAMYDLKLVKDTEPYLRRMNRSLIMGPDGQKMSKSRGNVIDPDEVVANLGADTVRMYLAFIGPYNEVASYPWNPNGVVGVRRFLERVWRLQERLAEKKNDEVERLLHATVKKVGEDIPQLKFNTAIAAMMSFLNDAEAQGITKAQYATLVRLLAPFAPHAAEELWHMLGNKQSIHLEKWPKYDAKKLKADTITIAVQVNGKSRGQVVVAADSKEAEVRAAAEEAVAKWLEDGEVKRIIYVPNRLINLVLA